MTTEKLTLNAIASAHDALVSISSETEISLDMQYKITDLIEAIEKNAQRFYDSKNKLLAEYGTLMPGTQRYNLDPERVEEYHKKLANIGTMKFEVMFVPLDFKALVKEDIKLKGPQLIPLKKHFIKREEQKAKDNGEAKSKTPDKKSNQKSN